VPDGNLILVLELSSLCPITVAEVPEALEKAPLSPYYNSILQIIVPSGIYPTGNTLPVHN
jgi:hypothetical protein